MLYRDSFWHVSPYTWHKQELFKGRNVLYGSGWAGWGFESNCVPEEVNIASTNVLAKLPIFEKGPDEMYSDTISLEWRNKLLAYAIPALSQPVGLSSQNNVFFNCDMNDRETETYSWCRDDPSYQDDWLHSDIQNVAFFYTYMVFDDIVERMGGTQ